MSLVFSTLPLNLYPVFNLILAKTQLLGTGEEQQRLWQNRPSFPALLLVDWHMHERPLP